MTLRTCMMVAALLPAFAACGEVQSSDISIVSGNKQSGPAGERLPEPLVVLVSDVNQEPMENITVDFKLIDGLGTISTESLRTDSLGRAQTFLTLGTKPGTTAIEARADGLDMTPQVFTETTVAAAPAQLIRVTDDQEGTVNVPLVRSLAVRIEDTYQNPVIGTPVTFAVTINNGSLSATSVVTGDDGIASTELTLGSAVGANQVEARASALPDSVIQFNARGYADSAASLVASGSGATGIAGSALTSPFVVTALDASGNPAPGATITFAITAGGGHMSAQTVATDAQGQARSTLTLGTTMGMNTVEARSGTLTAVEFSATGVAGAASKVIAVSGAVQSGLTAGNQAAPLIALVTDANDNPVAGASVSFTGGSVSPSNATTGSNGRAQTILTTSTTAGGNTIYANAGGASALFSVTTNAGPATHLVSLAGLPGSATVASQLALVVQARDQYENPVSGLTIAFSTSGGSISAPSPTTDGQGRVQATWTLPTGTGTYGLSASSGGMQLPFNNVTATADAPSSLSLGGDNQNAICDGGDLPSLLSVTVLDRFNNRVTNASVSFDTTDGCFSSSPGCPKQVTVGVDGQGTASVRYNTSTYSNGFTATEHVNARVGGLVRTFSMTVHGC